MAEIKELGESLLQRAEKRNDQQYKRSRREAYKIALGTAGMGMINEVLQKKADNFMMSEQVLAQKAKYRAAVEQSQSILSMNEEIVKSGKTAEQYFADTRYLPAMQEQFKAQYGSNIVPTTYMPQLLEQARSLAAEDAARFNESLAAAQAIPDYETAMSSVDSLVMPPRTPAGALFRKVSGIFSGKSEQDFRDQAVDQVRERGLIKNETWERLFNNISANEGIDKAVSFVERMDQSGFEATDDIERDTEVFKNDDGSYDVIHVTTVNRGTPTVTRDVVDVSSSRAMLNQREGQDKLVKALMEQNNPTKMATDNFTPDGIAEFNRRAGYIGVSTTDVQTPQDFARLADIYQNLSANVSYLKDPETTARTAGADAALIGNAASLFIRLSSPDTPEEERAQIIEQIASGVSAARQAMGVLRTPAGGNATQVPDVIRRTQDRDWTDL